MYEIGPDYLPCASSNSLFSKFLFSRSRYSKHSTLLFLGLTHAIMPQETILKANRNANGMLLFPLASMIAEEMNGPINEDVFPIIENREKNRNSFPLGQTSEIILSLASSQNYIRLTICIPRTDNETIICLV